MGNNQSSDGAPANPRHPHEHMSEGKQTHATAHRQIGQHPHDHGSAQTSSSSQLPTRTQSARKPPNQDAAARHHVSSLPPTSTLMSSGGSASTSTSNAHAHATVSASPQPSHNRGRSLTASTIRSEALQSDPSSSTQPADSTPLSLLSRVATNPASTPVPQPGPSAPVETPHAPSPPPAAQPVDVPLPTQHDTSYDPDAVPSDYSESASYSLAPTNFNRPPRLPLPIEEEVYTPGSPIITPQDVAVASLANADIGGDLPRQTSVLSSTTVDDDDDDEDIDAFTAEGSTSLDVRVPTRLEWNGAGNKIFVTGTFCHWEKKIKLERNKDGPGFSRTVMLPPGTHHIKFLMDGEMVTSNDLPTTVDWSNILVNYIEIVAPLPVEVETIQEQVPAEPIPIPGAPATKDTTYDRAGSISGPSGDTAEDIAVETEATHLPTDEAARVERNDHAPPSTAPGPTLPMPVSRAPSTQGAAPPTPTDEEAKRLTSTAVKKFLPSAEYTTQIPQFLLDFDNYQQPEDERYQRAQRVIASLPQPPSLPMFLGKSILNMTTPHKDDASVLQMPNYVQINHLATSSIKNGVLATSATTRYNRKFLTTIMYKPTTDD